MVILARSCISAILSGASIRTFTYHQATTTAESRFATDLASLLLSPSLHSSLGCYLGRVLSQHGVRNVSTSLHACDFLLTLRSKPSFGDSLFTFFALYLTTLFSLDSWAAARNSPYRAPGNNAFYRPVNTLPAPDSYQGGMHGRGNAGPGSGGGGSGGNVGRVPQARDSRPPMKLVGTASCGACLS